jgi:hypothetical protein
MGRVYKMGKCIPSNKMPNEEDECIYGEFSDKVRKQKILFEINDIGKGIYEDTKRGEIVWVVGGIEKFRFI